MLIDYQLMFNYIGEIIGYCIKPAIAIGLIERVVKMVIHAATGRWSD